MSSGRSRRTRGFSGRRCVVAESLCKVEKCERTPFCRGWCKLHYQRWYRHGEPGDAAPRYVRHPSPEESFAARTERRGDCLIWTGAIDAAGYGTIRVSGKMKLAHRYAWEKVHGPLDSRTKLDHKVCYTPACVNVEHLRPATDAQNARNRSGPTKNSTTGLRNVYRRRSKFVVLVGIAGKQRYFGTFSTAEEAAQVAEAKRQELFGVYAGRG